MVRKKFLVLMLAGLFLLLVACSNDEGKGKQPELDQEALDNVNKSDFPIVKDEIALKMFTAKSQVNANEDWNDLLVWNTYEDQTNIDVEWTEQVTMDGLEEKRNLALASGTLPDAFFAANISNLDLYKYGQQGTFLELNELIDEYAPNLKKFMEENPSVKKGMTFPDGKIYSMPALRDQDFLSVRIGARPWINENWLDKLGMNVPETTDDLYAYLKAVKEEDPNGNGQADEIPYGGVNMDHLIGWVRGAYGLGANGVGDFDKDPNGDGLRFIPTSDGYKEMLEYLNKLYSEELIEQNIFSIEWGQFMANAAEGKYGLTTFYNPKKTFGGVEGDNYTNASALKGPNGDQMYSNVVSPLFNNGAFVITKENPNPAAAVRWMDHFYSDEGAKLMYMGVEGETFKEENGEFKYVDEIENSEEKNQLISKYLPWVGVNPPGVVKQKFFIGSEASEESLKAAEDIKPYVPEDLWAEFTYTEDENKLLSSKGADIEKYVKEMRDKFISGATPLSEWDNYVKTIEDMGLEEYMTIQEDAYKRYEEAE